MKIGACANFSFPHVGGSENVLKNISERLAKDYGFEVNVYSYICKSYFSENSVKYFPCLKDHKFISQIEGNDHIFLYSDSFWGFDSIARSIHNMGCKVSVVLVGAYHMRSHPKILDLLKKNINKFNIITHSSITPDYKWCINNGLPVKVIPNGVSLLEFENSINFREKYEIKEKYVLLNVSSFFYGKGQELLPQIYKKLSGRLDDFIILSVSNTARYPYDKVFLDRTKKQSRGMNIRFLRDLPREDVIAAFNCSDIFLMPSKKEVAPLVILESMASGTPWVSMDVGNVRELEGGGIVVNPMPDKKGYKVVTEGTISKYVDNITNILSNPILREELGKKGRIMAEERYNWDDICEKYYNIFIS